MTKFFVVKGASVHDKRGNLHVGHKHKRTEVRPEDFTEHTFKTLVAQKKIISEAEKAREPRPATVPVIPVETDANGNPIENKPATEAEAVARAAQAEVQKRAGIETEDEEDAEEDEAEGQDSGSPPSPFTFDPASLAGKDLVTLNAMILERAPGQAPFETAEEAVAFLSQDA